MFFGGHLSVFSCLCLLYFVIVESVYLPGLAPVNYCKRDISKDNRCKWEIPVFVNKLTSVKSFISYKYDSIDSCETKTKDTPVENLGQIVFGERLQRSAYNINFGEAVTCKKLCEKTYSQTSDTLYKKLRDAVKMHYSHHWVVDNLPVMVCLAMDNQQRYCSISIPLGCFGDALEPEEGICQSIRRDMNSAVLLNHADFVIYYHSATDSWSGEETNRIVSVQVNLRSLDHTNGHLDCMSTVPLLLPEKSSRPISVTYSYGVTFLVNKDIKWVSRWDYILQSMPQSNIQWLSILNSVVLVLFLSILVATILLRTLRRDIARYSQLENSSEVQEESGWKLVHGDVFRPPAWGMLLSVMLGSGSQIFIMTLVTLFFACLGFLSPANRGALMSCALAMYVLSGIVAGYTSASVYKFIGGLRWKTNVLLTATVCPGVVFVIFFILNVALWALHSATAVPFGITVALVTLWLCVSVPLCFVGSFFGFRKPTLDVPLRTNQIPRQIPFLVAYSRPTVTFFLGGMLPFSCIFIQLFFIFNSIWGAQFYYMFGLLFLVFIMLIITCSETAILLCYFQLCSEDYRWWWRTFHSGAGTSFYIFIYSIHYFTFRLEYKDAISVFLYFGYISIIVWLAFLVTGTIGFLACLWFVRKIYAVVKVD